MIVSDGFRSSGQRFARPFRLKMGGISVVPQPSNNLPNLANGTVTTVCKPGDLIVAWQNRASATIPLLMAGFDPLATATDATPFSARLSCRRATAENEVITAPPHAHERPCYVVLRGVADVPVSPLIQFNSALTAHPTPANSNAAPLYWLAGVFGGTSTTWTLPAELVVLARNPASGAARLGLIGLSDIGPEAAPRIFGSAVSSNSLTFSVGLPF